MRRIYKYIAIGVLSLFTCTSCEDYFDSVPSDLVSFDDIFTNRGLTLQWLTNVYSYLPDDTNQSYAGSANEVRGVWTSASIEGKLPWDHCVGNNIILGTLYPSTDYVKDMWVGYYRGIQKANVYMANVERCQAMTPRERAWSHDEARALRAIYYFNIFKLFGPFVIVGDNVYDHEGDIDDMMLERSSVDECVEYMTSEFDAVLANGNLVSHFNDAGAFDTQFAGNITKEAVEGLRSEMLLYAASSLFNGDPFYTNVQNRDGKKLFPQSADATKWQKARDAAKAFIDNNTNFSLVYRDRTGKAVADIISSCPFNSTNQAALGMRDNEEMIFFRTGPDFRHYYTMTPKHSGVANAQSGGGGLSAPLQMVDLYFTKNGLRIEDDPDYFTYENDNPGTARNMSSLTEYRDQYSSYTYFKPGASYRIMNQYYDREPRFYVAFTFQNRRWDFDQSREYYTDFSLNGNSGKAKNGHDYPKSGVLVRKKMTGSLDVPYYIYLRLSGIYLNYAEASNECGDMDTALEYVNKIRARAGVNGYSFTSGDKDARGVDCIQITKDKDMVTNVIRRERLIELSYENHHYFDVRRWGVADMAQGDGCVYPSWHAGGEGGEMRGYYIDIDMGSTNAMSFYTRKNWETRIFSKRMSLFPIPQTEINRNNKIVQNAGWESL